MRKVIHRFKKDIAWVFTHMFIFYLSISEYKSQCPPPLSNIQFSPIQLLYCPNQTITVTFSSPDYIVFLDWDYPGPPQQQQSGQQNSFTLNGLGNGGPLNINGMVELGGQGGTPCPFNLSTVINTHPPIIADAGADLFFWGVVSAGNIGGSPTGIGTPPFTYVWTPSSNLNNNFSPNPTASPPTTTMYQITVTDGNGCDSQPDTVIVHHVNNVVNNKCFAVLHKNLDAGYQNSVNLYINNTLYFMFEEEYYISSGTNLRYEVIDNTGAVVPSPFGTPIKVIGDNRYSVSMANLSGNAHYRLKVYNEKNEVWQTRFKVN